MRIFYIDFQAIASISKNSITKRVIPDPNKEVYNYLGKDNIDLIGREKKN